MGYRKILFTMNPSASRMVPRYALSYNLIEAPVDFSSDVLVHFRLIYQYHQDLRVAFHDVLDGKVGSNQGEHRAKNQRTPREDPFEEITLGPSRFPLRDAITQRPMPQERLPIPEQES
mmetsp:Transcript_21069/g.49989  ORF Transcript_21069/g.49989 Transcript_21069/m.49989 type:complete len:118 (+) Transcript_21069:144-497(+)